MTAVMFSRSQLINSARVKERDEYDWRPFRERCERRWSHRVSDALDLRCFSRCCELDLHVKTFLMAARFCNLLLGLKEQLSMLYPHAFGHVYSASQRKLNLKTL